MRLIDVDDLGVGRCSKDVLPAAYCAGWNGLLGLIEKAPTVDAVPVVHGRWVDGKCSNCGVDIPTDDSYDAIFGNECHFCYYCGARMDGGDKR